MLHSLSFWAFLLKYLILLNRDVNDTFVSTEVLRIKVSFQKYWKKISILHQKYRFKNKTIIEVKLCGIFKYCVYLPFQFKCQLDKISNIELF